MGKTCSTKHFLIAEICNDLFNETSRDLHEYTIQIMIRKGSVNMKMI